MARFLSMKVAPGFRVSASSRGLRAHVGPRGARVHVGGGRTGVSTGVGPLTAYQSIGGSSRARAAKAPSGLTPAQAEKFRRIEGAQLAFASLEQLHRGEFASPVPEVAQMARLPQFHKLLMTAEKQALRGVNVRDREGRRAARAAARQQAETWALDILTLAVADVESRQRAIDEHWQALHDNHPEAVAQTLTTEFTRQGRAIRVAQVLDGEAGLLITIPGPTVVPTHKPAVTPGGASTLHKVNKTEHAEWYAQVVASHILLAAKEAFALAPALTAVRVVAVDGAGLPFVATRITRERLGRVDWGAGAWPILHWLDANMRCDVRGRTREMHTMDLRDDEVFGALLR